MLWNARGMNFEDFMKSTRRKPVLSLAETVPFNVLNSQSRVTSENKPLVTQPAKEVLKLKSTNILAKSYIVYDLKDSRVVSEKNSNQQLPPASLVKLLSVMVFTDNLNLDNYTLVPQECTQVNGQKLGFRSGEKVSIKDLLYSALIYSAADSVCTLSRINSGQDLTFFNSYAKSIGMNSSNFTNYIGLDYEDNVTTAEDVLTMTLNFIKKDLFNSIVKLKSYQLENGKVIYNTNKMLFENQYSIGIKTGTTGEANENLIYRYKNDELKRDIIVIILNSSSRYQDTRNIISNLYLAEE
jgi:D-alanyl-D-alanine carboxypeptidase